MKIIKYPPKRLEFEKFLKKIGYRNRLPLKYKVQEQRNLILENSDIGPIKINGFIKVYPNKKSYIWFCYQEMLNNPRGITEEDLRKTILMIGNQINLNKHSRVAEVGWEVLMSHTIKLWSKSDRTKMYFKILRELKLILKNGDWGITPNPGEILVSRPRGLRYGAIRGPEEEKERGHINQKIFNFGKVNWYGDQYAIYDENLNLQPISI